MDDRTLAVELRWLADRRPGQDWTVFVHLLDPEGQVAAQHDGVPEVGFRPTSSWAAGEVVVDTHWLVAPGVEALDGARLSIGLYDPATGQRSEVVEATDLRAGPGAIDSYVLEVDQGIR